LPIRQFLPNSRRDAGGTEESQSGLLQRSDMLRRIAASVVERFAPSYVIVDESGRTLFFSSGTGKYLQPAVGPPNRDIVAMARPGLRADLRAALHRAKETGQRVRV
jgi:two-component system CheB/CheR fusion protein